VETGPQPLPVVRGQVVQAGAPHPLVGHVAPSPQPPQHRPVQRSGPAGHRHGAPGHHPRKSDNGETRDRILIGSVLGGGALLICGLIWVLQNAHPGEAPASPAAEKPASANHPARDKEMERLEAKQKELEKEIEHNKVIRENQEKSEMEAIRAERLRQDAAMASQRSKLRHYYAKNLFEGDEEAAGEFITELENVRNELAMLPEDAKERRSKEATDKFYATRLVVLMEKNSVLYHWLEAHGRKAEDLLPGLAHGNPKGADGSPPGNHFDFSKYASSGSGFWISADGWLLTNHHVVDTAKTVDVRLRDGTIIQANVIKTDTVNDLALLKAATSAPGWLPVSKGESELKLGQTVFTIGYPNADIQGLEPKFTDGRVSSVTGFGDSKNSYQTTVPIRHGNSGGPLVDLLTGWVVGVFNAGLTDGRSGTEVANVSYAIKGKVVCTFLESVPEVTAAIQAKPAAVLKKGDERAVIDRVKDAAILILKRR